MTRAVQAPLGMVDSIHPSNRSEFNRVLDAAGGNTYTGIWFPKDYTNATIRIHNADTHQVMEEHVLRASADAETYERQARIGDM